MTRTLPLLLLVWSVLSWESAAAQESTDQILTPPRAVTVESRSSRPPQFPPLRRSADSEQGSGSEDRSVGSRMPGSLITICSSLAVVLGLFAGLVWINRKLGGGGGNHGSIPKEVVQSLGSTPIDSRNRITMLRCGNRILVLAQNAQGVQPISEITSPEEVHQLTAACLGNSKQAFASTLQSIEQEPSQTGFLDTPPRPKSSRARGRLFASA